MNTKISYQTLENNTVKYMLKYVEEYELVRQKKHEKYKYVNEFFKSKQICFQNFYKFYKRFIAAGKDPQALLPTRRGPKPKYLDMPIAGSLEAKVLDYRKMGYNKYIIAESLKKDPEIKNSPSISTVYRILKRYGVSKLTKPLKEEKKKIVRDRIGSLVHIDCHYLPKGIVQEEPQKRYYTVGVVDDFSRILWIEVIESVKAMDVAFAMMDIILIINQRYGIKIDEVLTDNGSEFCSGRKSVKDHPFERLLLHFAIKHRKTRPYTPKTNGKIERIWRTFDEDVIEGSVFNTLDELKEAVLGYNFYYNEERPHQGIDGKKPVDMLSLEEKSS